jgi:zinc/manganese transport system ATP-binding protein
LNKAEKRKIEEALALTQAEHLAHKSVGSMSGGEKQKIFLAQAIVSDPLLLLLDEPTSNLDPGAQEKMASVVSAICREKQVGVLFISHDINLISQYADYLLFLTRGHYAYGSVEQIMRPDVLTGLYGMKVEVGRSGGRYVVLPEAERSAAICFHEEAHEGQPLLLGGK